MPWAAIILYLAVILLVGAAGQAIFARQLRFSIIEQFGYAIAIGAGALPMLLFWLSLAGRLTNVAILLGLAAVGILFLLFLSQRKAQWQDLQALAYPPSPPLDFWQLVLIGGSLIVLMAAFLNVASALLTPGLVDIDAYGIWMLKAKLTATQPLLPITPALLDPALSYSHQDYPLGLPLLFGGFYNLAGGVHERAAKALMLPQYLALVMVAYGTIRRMLSRPAALALTASLLTAPTLVAHASTPVAELPLVLFITCAAASLLRWMQNGPRSSALAIGLFASFAAFTKNEGLALLPMFALSMILFAAGQRRANHWKDILAAACTTALLLAPWLIYRTYLPKTHEDYGSKLLSPAAIAQGLPRLGEIIRAIAGEAVSLGSAGPIWLLLLVALVFRPSALRCRAAQALWLLLLLQLGLYVLTFIVTPWQTSELLPMVLPKLMIQTSPLAALLAALHFAQTPVQPDPVQQPG